MRFLTEDEVDRIHRRQLRPGDETGGRRREAVRRCLAAAEAVADEGVASSAAAYATEIACSQPYADANQRTAAAAAIVFLTLNGWALPADERPRYVQIVRGLREDPQTAGELKRFLEGHLERMTGRGEGT